MLKASKVASFILNQLSCGTFDRSGKNLGFLRKKCTKTGQNYDPEIHKIFHT